MFTQRCTYLSKALAFTVTVSLLLATAAKPEVLSDDTLATGSPSLSDLPLTDHTINSSIGEAEAQALIRPCGDENDKYCLHGGTCVLPQDSNQTSCHCKPSYSGQRCEILVDLANNFYQPFGAENVIGIICGVIMVLIVLGLAICCFVKRRRVKSAPLIKTTGSENSV
ncbi:pro-epidermal growth factor [Fundulus heteroclitus]|uniref:pro-epidermal growth factor n=1 Tax=Fundulus heteroclitus TaxID=8078 RepID=UPI00165CB4C8|nr:pro-epidermal growth factor [Fundulus heteroclitus]XP_035999904.1 pro-epidermal growth factor [Fundulus heteroclitus]